MTPSHRIILALLPLSHALALDMPTVTVGNPGNAPDPLTGLGRVDHVYEIGKYEVTNAQFCEYANGSPEAKISNDSLAAALKTNPGVNVEESKDGGTIRRRYTPKQGMENLPFVEPGMCYLVETHARLMAKWMNGGEDSVEEINAGVRTVKTRRVKLDAKKRPMKDDSGKLIMEDVELEQPIFSYRRKAPAPGGSWYPADVNELFKAAFHDPRAGVRGVYFNHATGSNMTPGTTDDPEIKGARIHAAKINPEEESRSEKSDLKPVGTSAPGAYGAYDLCGNADEFYFFENRTKRTPAECRIPAELEIGFGGSVEDPAVTLSRSGVIVGHAHCKTGQSVKYYRISAHRPYGFRLVRIQPANTSVLEKKPAKAPAPTDLVTAPDGDIWIASLPELPAPPLNSDATPTPAKSGPKTFYTYRNSEKNDTWRWARATLAKLEGKTIRERSEAEQRDYSKKFIRNEGGNTVIGLPLMYEAARLETGTAGAKCKPVFDFSSGKSAMAIWQEYNRLAPKNARVKTDPQSFSMDVMDPLHQEGADIATLRKSRMGKTADIAKFEQKTIESLKLGHPLLWLAHTRTISPVPPGQRNDRICALITGVNPKTHEILFIQSPDEVEPYAILSRLPVAEAYAATTGLYQVQL